MTTFKRLRAWFPRSRPPRRFHYSGNGIWALGADEEAESGN